MLFSFIFYLVGAYFAALLILAVVPGKGRHRGTTSNDREVLALGLNFA